MGRTGEAVRRVTRDGFNPAWSPDGTELAYTTVATETKPQHAEQRGQLMVVAVNGGQPRALQKNVALQNSAMLPSWSPRGLRIAFGGGVVSAAPGSNVMTVTPAGGDLVPVTQDAFLNWNPVWAPDGRHLYFVSNRGGSMNIWRVAIDEASGRTRGEPEPITTPAAFATHLSISADGRLLSYSAVQETQNVQKLRLDPVKGEVIGEPVPVTTGSRFWANPDPSPDGASVLFYSQVGPEGDLYVARSDDTGGLRQLTDDAALDRVPRWSPDGEWIAMFSNRSGRQHVWKIQADGSDLQQVNQAIASVVAWSPDGRRLAATRSRPEPGEPAHPSSTRMVHPNRSICLCCHPQFAIRVRGELLVARRQAGCRSVRVHDAGNRRLFAVVAHVRAHARIRRMARLAPRQPAHPLRVTGARVPPP